MKKSKRLKSLIFLCAIGLLGIIVFLSCNFNFNGNSEEEEPKTWETARPLKNIYTGEFLIGNIIRNTADFSNPVRSGILSRHYNTVTAENDMKPIAIAPNPAPASASVTWNYRWNTADTIVDNARNAGFDVHGHTLIWHSQSPEWLANGGETYLNKFVGDVVEHFKGRLISWDVVNEAMRDGLQPADVAGDWRNCLRLDARWYQSIGPEYIEKAFLAARAADPDAMLYYNDYSLNSFQGNNKQRAVYKMVQDINERYPNVGGRKLIDGIGMQSHHHLNTTPESVEASIQLFSSLGVEIAITEMDIMAAKAGYNNLMNNWDDSAAQLQAKKYAAMFRIFINHSSEISRVTFWGLDDGTSWRASSRPTLLNGDYSLKPAFYAVSNPQKY